MKNYGRFGANFVPNRPFLRNKLLSLQRELKFYQYGRKYDYSNHFKFGFSYCDVWGIVLVHGETKAGAPRRNGTPKRYDCGKHESVSRTYNTN